MYFRKEVLPFIALVTGFSTIVAIATHFLGVNWQTSLYTPSAIVIILTTYLLYFFRDPKRTTPDRDDVVISPADGKVAQIVNIKEDKYLKTECVRISIFLSLFDVHVNRSPISGMSKYLGYFPGKRFFTFDEKSSEFNQHNAILVTNNKIKCLYKQIVGPVARRVVYWPDNDNEVELKAGDKIGMMKFGSRLDMYFPKDSIKIRSKIGDVVRAGETIMADIL